jgi:hypothetical protein
VGEAHRGHPGEQVGAVAASVTGLDRGRAVVAEAVGLDDEAQIGKEEVDLEAVQDLFAERHGKACFHCDWAEEDLKIGVREEEGALVEELAQGLHAGLASVVIESGPQRLRVNQVQLVRLVDRALTGMQSIVVTFSDASDGRPRTCRPGRLSSHRRRTLTSIRPFCSFPMPQSAAALRWLNIAPSPEASTPAIHRRFWVSSGHPTA